MTTLAAEKELKHLGESQGIADHDHDLVHELSRRLDAVWRFDQYIANAENRPELQKIWHEMKAQEFANIKQLKRLVEEEVRKDCF
jgi:hypothetical protein